MNNSNNLDLAPVSVIESELEVLNAFITNPNTLDEYIDILKPIHFYSTSYQAIYENICGYYKRNKQFDLITITEDLKDRVDYTVVSEILNGFGHAVPTHVENILNAYKARELRRTLLKTLGEITKENVNDLIDDVENKCLELNSCIDKNSYESAENINFKVLERIQEAYIKGEGNGYITGIRTGYQRLDNALGGLKKKQYYVIAARPSMGKSALSLSLLNGIAEDKKILYVQLDMTKGSMITRMLSMKTNIANRNLSRGKLTDNQWAEIGLKGTPRKNLFISDKAGTTVSDIRAMARKLKFKNGLDILIIDHLGKIKPSARGSIYEQMTKISNELKELSRELNVVLIGLSQLSRGVEQRADKRPMLSDLRDSGRIEEDADAILMLYRDGYYKAREKREQILNDELEVSIQKNRDGLTGTILFDYDLEKQIIREKFN